MQNPILEVKNLTKRFGEFTAVDNISFSLKEGEVLGFLGPNGAGKTTTIHMLLGITLYNGGSISYFGKDFSQHRQYCLQRLNFASAFNTLQGRISVFENLMVFGYLYGLINPKKRIAELAEQFSIAHLLDKRYWDISTGQKTIVNIVKSLINEPKLLLMDEPTASLDPDIADKTLSFIETIRKTRNVSILYTSHDMSEVTRICDRVIFLGNGKIVAEDSPIGFTKRITNAQLKITFDAKKTLVKNFIEKERQQFSFLSDNIVLIDSEERLIPKLIFSMGKANIWITDIEVKKATLEDVFLQIARGKTYAK